MPGSVVFNCFIVSLPFNEPAVAWNIKLGDFKTSLWWYQVRYCPPVAIFLVVESHRSLIFSSLLCYVFHIVFAELLYATCTLLWRLCLLRMLLCLRLWNKSTLVRHSYYQQSLKFFDYSVWCMYGISRILPLSLPPLHVFCHWWTTPMDSDWYFSSMKDPMSCCRYCCGALLTWRGWGGGAIWSLVSVVSTTTWRNLFKLKNGMVFRLEWVLVNLAPFSRSQDHIIWTCGKV